MQRIERGEAVTVRFTVDASRCKEAARTESRPPDNSHRLLLWFHFRFEFGESLQGLVWIGKCLAQAAFAAEKDRLILDHDLERSSHRAEAITGRDCTKDLLFGEDLISGWEFRQQRQRL